MAYIMTFVPDDQIEPRLTAHLVAIGPSQTPQSLRARRATVLRVAKKIGKPVAEATYPELLDWQISQAHLKKSSMAAALTHLNCYLKWLVKHGHRADNPAADLARPRNAYRRNPHPMGDPDITRARDAADPMMRAWIGLGAFCGLRCMEIATVARADVGAKLCIHGKGGKERTVHLPGNLRAELDAFPDRGLLWRDAEGPYTAARVSRLINAHLRRCGIVGTAHALRHRFGTALYEKTKDAVLVQNAMGHESVETTMCYVRAVGDSATDAAIEAISHLAA